MGRGISLAPVRCRVAAAPVRNWEDRDPTHLTCCPPAQPRVTTVWSQAGELVSGILPMLAEDRDSA